MAAITPMPPFRLACLTTHPIPYHVALFRRVAREKDLTFKVFFGSDHTAQSHFDPGFAAHFTWDVPLRDGYENEVLPMWGEWPHEQTFWRPYNRGLSRRLKDGRFDCLWIQPYHRLFHYQAVLEARRLGLRVLVRGDPAPISQPRSALKRWAKRRFFAGYHRLVDRFLAIGTLNAAYWSELGVPAHKIGAIPYAVDNAFFRTRAPADTGALRRQLGIPADARVVLSVAKFQHLKCPHHLLEAFRRLPAALADTTWLVFIGEGELRREIERQAAGLERVCFVGFKGQQELPAYFSLCDTLVLPSAWEAWGLVVNEAMNFAKPIIVSDRVGSGADLVRHGENGFVFPVGDIAALTRALEEVLADPERARRMGRRSLEIIDTWDFEADVRGLRETLGLAPTTPSLQR